MNICKIQCCDKNVHGYGLCWKHYTRNIKYGDPEYKVKEYERHGLCNTREYSIWRCMKHRCDSKLGKNSKYYCDKNIHYDKRWTIFSNFLSDMGNTPTIKHTLDRVDSNRGYSKSNCRWATPYEQTMNRGINGNNTSGYIGVGKVNGRWGAFATYDRKPFYIGTYDTPEEAANMRDQYMINLHNGVCTTNFNYI